MKGYRGRYIFALCLTVIGQIMYITNPIFSQKIVDEFIYSNNPVKAIAEHKDVLIGLCLCIIVFTLVRTTIQFSANMLYEKCSQGMLSKIRSYLFKNVQRQDMSFYDKNTTGDLMIWFVILLPG